MARAIDRQALIDLIIDAKRTDPETGSFTEWLADYLIKHLSTLTPPNEPLTLEQLREMDGEPVYIISEFYHISEWNIPNGIGEIVITYDVPCAGMKEVIPSIKFIDGKELAVEKYGSSWVAYRRPPEGEV